MKKNGPSLLRKERQKRKMTQDQASAFLGISQALISMYETGRNAPGLKNASKLQKKFRIPLGAWT